MTFALAWPLPSPRKILARSPVIQRLLYLALAGLWGAPVLAHASGRDCASLTALVLPHAVVTSAAEVSQFPPAGRSADQSPPLIAAPFCRVAVTARPTPESDIRIELWIPPGEAWNGRYLQVGNGGFAGRIPYRSLAAGLRQGYAVAGTDDGHEALKDDDSTDAAWAKDHPEKVVDFGYRALKATTDLSKAILAAYAAAPKFSYFNGCSDGGREALMEVQRFPEDFDGVVAGDPANDWTHLQAAGLMEEIALWRIDPNPFPLAKLAPLQAAARRACADETGVIDNPLTCRFDPKVILCRSGEGPDCLTPLEAAQVGVYYGGARDGAGRLILPGLEPGAEAAKNGWGRWVIGDASGGEASLDQKFTRNFFAYVVGRPDYVDQRRFVYDRDMPAVEARFAPVLNATDPDLSKFKARGGKLIQYHGWADPAIPAKASIIYFETVQRTMGDTADFYRLFMVPGMLHCQGGPGASVFDVQGAVRRWVETGAAPRAMTAVKFVDDDPAKGAAFTRPLCPYPETAAYTGGDRSKAQSYTCAHP